MNLGQVKRNVRMLGRNYFGTEADRDPFGLDYLIIETANQIARQTDCLVGRRYLDLTVDVNDYCAPDIYKIKLVKIKNTNDEYEDTRLFNFDNQYITRWLNEPPAQRPDIVVTRGMNSISVYPATNTTITNGLLIEGYAQPGDIWEYDSSGNALPNNDTTECPLPEVAHDCLVYGILQARAMQMLDMNGMQVFKAEYLDRLSMVENFASIYMRRSR
jgi:hypothetical protein